MEWLDVNSVMLSNLSWVPIHENQYQFYQYPVIKRHGSLLMIYPEKNRLTLLELGDVREIDVKLSEKDSNHSIRIIYSNGQERTVFPDEFYPKWDPENDDDEEGDARDPTFSDFAERLCQCVHSAIMFKHCKTNVELDYMKDMEKAVSSTGKKCLEHFEAVQKECVEMLAGGISESIEPVTDTLGDIISAMHKMDNEDAVREISESIRLLAERIQDGQRPAKRTKF